jgi:nuclear transcription factor Y gamma
MSNLETKLKQFWEEMMEDVKESGLEVSDFKTQQLPLARIKKIMKSDEDVRMISAEAPVLFAKACEFFILEMTLRAWQVAEENNRRTLTRQDISAAVNRTEVWDFLADIVPTDGQEGDGQGNVSNRMQQQQQMAESYPFMIAGPPAFVGGMPMMYPSGAGMPPQMFMQQQQQSNTPNHETTTGSGADQEEEGALAVGRQTKKQKQ